MGGTVTFAANGGTCEGYLARPAAAGPGVVVVQEWWGLDDHVKSLADRFAAEGFVALAPDLYHGTVTKSPDEAGKLAMALEIGRGMSDLEIAVMDRSAEATLGRRERRALARLKTQLTAWRRNRSLCSSPNAARRSIIARR